MVLNLLIKIHPVVGSVGDFLFGCPSKQTPGSVHVGEHIGRDAGVGSVKTKAHTRVFGDFQ